MPVVVRRMRVEEARKFLEIHHASVRGLAGDDYPPSVIELWAPNITEAGVQTFLANPDDEIRLIAEIDGEPVGIGALIVARSELKAC